MVAHPCLDHSFPGGIEAGGWKQDTHNARREALTVAVFRPWRGSRRAVVWDPSRYRSAPRPNPQNRAAAGEFSSAKADCGYRAPLAPRLARPTGQGGIRTHEALTPTRVPVVLLKPLGHLSLPAIINFDF